jgi:hypothetical protein
LALNMASQGPYLEGEAVEYIGFLKETHKHKLHMLLWTNQEKMSSYAASIRSVCVLRDALRCCCFFSFIDWKRL